MIFAARGLLVSLAFFATVYCALSSLVILAWRCTGRASGKSRPWSANLLFGLRMFSFAASTLIAIFFTFPSFWLMESASLDEDAATFVLAWCSLLILGAGLFRVLRAHAGTMNAVAGWTLETGSTGRRSFFKPTLCAALGAPALVLVGIRRPRVMVSDMAAVVLTPRELQVAVRHELGHKRSWDNLRRVLISATPFPGMSSLDSAWRQAAELAADDVAVRSRQDALDLAAALIKLSSSSKQWSEPALATGLVSGSSSITLRVKRLIEWRTDRPRFQRISPWILVALLVLVGAVAQNYGAALVLTHRLTELLVP